MSGILLEIGENIIIAIISGGVALVTTLIGATVTYRLSAKKDKDEQVAAVKAELIKYHEKNKEEIRDIRQSDLREIREDIGSIRDDVTTMGANLQQKLALLELSQTHTREDVSSLKTEVEKHNGVIERVYHLEDNDKLLDEKIKVANHRIEDLEKKL